MKHIVKLAIVNYDRILNHRQKIKDIGGRLSNIKIIDYLGQVYAQSETTNDQWYKVSLRKNTCECKAYQKLRDTKKPHWRCKHLWAAKEQLLRDGPKLPWIAKIAGMHPIFEFQRIFVRGNLDFRYMKKDGKCGVRMMFVVEEGYSYEANEHVRFSRDRLFYFNVQKYGITEICKNDIHLKST